MSTIMTQLTNIINKRLVIQFILLAMGAAISIALVIIGLLQEDPFLVLTAPLLGISVQLQMILSITIGPLLILLFGVCGFLSFFVLPGLIISRGILQNLRLPFRYLLGTAISLLIMFFVISYGLINGISPPWLVLFLPMLIAALTVLIHPNTLTEAVHDIERSVRWVVNDIRDKRNVLFWLVIVFFMVVRIAMFCFTDSYWTDSVTYVGYAEAISTGTLLTGYAFVNPIGFPLVTYPFTWLAGSITWGLALANWCLTLVALVGALPMLRRIHTAWPTEHKPPFRFFVLAFLTVPWLTIELSVIFHESVLFFFTILGTEAVCERIKYSEMWLGLAAGVGFLIRQTHALLYFVFMLIPLYNARASIRNFFLTGIRSFVVAAPVIPLLVRNLRVVGVLLAEYDISFFGVENIPLVAKYVASFITHSTEGFFSILFAVPLLVTVVRFLPRLRRLNAEIWAWILLAVSSTVVFFLYPTDQPRLFSFFLWLIPLFLVLELWDLGWQFTACLYVVWQLLVFGAVVYSPQGWLITSATSFLASSGGLVRPLPGPEVFWLYGGIALMTALWLMIVYVILYMESHAQSLPSKEN